MFRGRAGRWPGSIFPPFGWSPQVTFPFQLHLGNKGRRDTWGGKARNTQRPATNLEAEGGGKRRREGQGRDPHLDPDPGPAAPHVSPARPSAEQADMHILFKCHISFDPGQCFSMCLAQLLPREPPPPLTPFVYFPGEPHPPPSIWKALRAGVRAHSPSDSGLASQ